MKTGQGRGADLRGGRGLRGQLGAYAGLLVANLTHGCAVPPADQQTTASEPALVATGSGGNARNVVPEIKNGHPVNSKSDPVSFLFPLSTVHIETPSHKCTGVILSSTKILTAAHCLADNSTVIYMYGANGATPEYNIGGPGLKSVLESSPHSVDVPEGVTGTNPTDKNGNWSDLAMLNIAWPGLPNTTPWAAVAVTPLSSYYMVRTGPNNPAWAVGTGQEDGQPNPAMTMQFQPSETSSTNDLGGYFETKTCETDHGDSGGPLFEATGPTTGAVLGNLVLVGILTGLVEPVGSLGIHVCTSSRYTSLAFPSNYQWIQSELGPVASRKMISDYFLNRLRPPQAWELIPVGKNEGWRRSDETASVFPELSSKPR